MRAVVSGFDTFAEWSAAMMGVYAAMPVEERESLHAWEEEHLDGHSVATSDWPGWEKYIGVPPWKADGDHRPKRGVARKKNAGFVYVVQGNGQFKIGRATNPEARIKAIAGGLPFGVQIVCVLRAENAIALEREMHERFAARRLGGEWFALSSSDLAEIEAEWGDLLVRAGDG